MGEGQGIWEMSVYCSVLMAGQAGHLGNVGKLRRGIAIVSDQTSLPLIARSANAQNVRLSAVCKITDQVLLADVAATTGDDSIVAITAVNRITNREMMMDVIARAALTNVRPVTLGKIDDQAALVIVAKTNTDETVRFSATRKLKDQVVLAEIANLDASNDVRVVAALKVTDKELASLLAKHATNGDVQRIASRNSTVAGYLAEIRIQIPDALTVGSGTFFWEEIKEWLVPEYADISGARTESVWKTHPRFTFPSTTIKSYHSGDPEFFVWPEPPSISKKMDILSNCFTSYFQAKKSRMSVV